MNIRKIINEDNDTSRILHLALITLVDDILDGYTIMDTKLERTLGIITHNTSIRWKWVLKRLHVRCYECGNLLNNNNTDCARFECFTCGEISMIKSKTLRSICGKCVSFKDTCNGPINTQLEEPIVTKLPLIYRKGLYGK